MRSNNNDIFPSRLFGGMKARVGFLVVAASFVVVHPLTCPEECYTSTITQLQRRVVELERLLSKCKSRHGTVPMAASPERRHRPNKNRLSSGAKMFTTAKRFGPASMPRQIQSVRDHVPMEVPTDYVSGETQCMDCHRPTFFYIIGL